MCIDSPLQLSRWTWKRKSRVICTSHLGPYITKDMIALLTLLCCSRDLDSICLPTHVLSWSLSLRWRWIYSKLPCSAGQWNVQTSSFQLLGSWLKHMEILSTRACGIYYHWQAIWNRPPASRSVSLAGKAIIALIFRIPNWLCLCICTCVSGLSAILNTCVCSTEHYIQMIKDTS